MKTFFKWGMMTLGCLACAGGLFSTCAADQPSFLNVTASTAASSGSSAASVGINTEFVAAATYKVEHEPMTLNNKTPQAAPVFPDVNHIVTREAHVTIGGLPGETVFVTCNVSNTHNAQKNTRDCGGAPTVEQRAIMSGQQLDDGVLLTNDLLPNNNSGKSESTVTFEVSYL